MMFENVIGLLMISAELDPLETPSDDQPRVPTMITASGSAARITGMTWLA